MKGRYCLLIACLAGTFAACTPPPVPPPALADSFGPAGGASGKTGDNATHISVTQWQHGDQLTYYILGQLPGEDPAPVALLLIRGTSPNGSQANGSAGEREGQLYWRGQLTAANGKSFDLAYDINYKPPGDELKLGGQSYDFDSGRFFLLDLTQDPVKPVQLKENIVILLPSRAPIEQELRDAVDKLKAQQDKVRKFLESAH